MADASASTPSASKVPGSGASGTASSVPSPGPDLSETGGGHCNPCRPSRGSFASQLRGEQPIQYREEPVHPGTGPLRARRRNGLARGRFGGNLPGEGTFGGGRSFRRAARSLHPAARRRPAPPRLSRNARRDSPADPPPSHGNERSQGRPPGVACGRGEATTPFSVEARPHRAKKVPRPEEGNRSPASGQPGVEIALSCPALPSRWSGESRRQVIRGARSSPRP